MGLIGIDVTGHLVLGVIEGGIAPTAAAGTNAGGAPPAPVIDAQAFDMRGNLTCGSGTVPAAGQLAVVTWGNPYATSSAPVVHLNGYNALGAGLGSLNAIPQGTPGNWTGFAIQCSTAPAASQANTTYGIQWWVVA